MADSAVFVVSEEGFWAEECYEPLRQLKDAGIDITVTTPSGDTPIVDESSLNPDEVGEATAREMAGMHATEPAIRDPIPLVEATDNDFDIAVFPGGHGTMFDINHDYHAQQLLLDAVDSGHALVICHAVGLLGFTRHPDGAFLADGRHVTGFPNAWEDDIVDPSFEILPNGVKLPYRVEDVVKAAGAHWDAELDQETSVTVDGTLITARGPESSTAAAETLLDEY